MQRGNLIELSAGTIGVDEACSGVRSLQSTLMASLFLGETYRLRAGWRISLVGAGLFLAFVFNVLRAFLLAWIGARQGIGALGRWHDQAGYSILLLCAISLWLIVTRLKHAHGEPETVTSAAPGVALGVNRWFPCVSLAILITAEVANVSWYRSRERQLADNPRWSARWPQDKAVEDVPITANTRLILGYDEGRAGSWRDEADRKWIMFFLRWEPGAPGSRMVARVHRPENCLPATGLQLVAEHGLKEHQAHGLPLPFRGYEFSFEGQPWHVFYCLWEDKSSAVALQRLQGFVPATGRLKAVWEGRRRQVGQQTLEVIITGCRSFEEATRAFAEALPSFVAPNPHPKK
jgi:exosortase/archaeosortase family protein